MHKNAHSCIIDNRDDWNPNQEENEQIKYGILHTEILYDNTN